MKFEYEKSPLNNIFYGGTETVNTYFVRQYIKIYKPQTSTEGLIPYTYKEDKLKETKHVKPLEPVNPINIKETTIDEFIAQVYDACTFF